MTKQKSLWKNNKIQFTRLLAELDGIGFSNKQIIGICTSMEITLDEFRELLDRAQEDFQKIKDKLCTK